MQSRRFRKKEQGFTIVEVMIVVVVIGLLAVLLLPTIGQKKIKETRPRCISNIKQVGLGWRLWANDNGDKFPWQVSISNTGTLEMVNGPVVAPHFLIASNELNSPKILTCSSDVQRSRVAQWSELTDMNLSYFVGLDASEAGPQSILSGDRNITGGTKVTNTVFFFGSNNVARFTKDIHNQTGNIGLGDGSAMQINARGLTNQINAALLSSGQPGLRLAIP